MLIKEKTKRNYSMFFIKMWKFRGLSNINIIL